MLPTNAPTISIMTGATTDGADRGDHEHHQLVERVAVDPLARVERRAEGALSGEDAPSRHHRIARIE